MTFQESFRQTAAPSGATVFADDSEITLLVPDDDAIEPEISVLIPAMNEKLTIGETIDWCKEGFKRARVVGEVLIIDSSTDDTPGIALAHGARVLKTPRRGLGRAYIDSIPYVRSNYIVMGDADCTYDFRELGNFLEEFRKGFDFVMGSRFNGYIEEGAMPRLHRHFGTPLTTAILNFLYSSKFSDIHCGMRGITKAALKRIRLESQSWEYASEMVLKSVCMNLRTTEVPVRFFKDRDGRSSHMKRGGLLEPWKAGWINLRAMLVYHADFFVLRPGFILLLIGMLLVLPQALGPVTIGPITLSIYWALLGVTCAVVGLHSFFLGCVLQVMYNYSTATTKRWLKVFSYTRALAASSLLAIAGVGLLFPLASKYISNGFQLMADPEPANHMAVTGLLLVIAGFATFSSTLALHAAALRAKTTATGTLE